MPRLQKLQTPEEDQEKGGWEIQDDDDAKMTACYHFLNTHRQDLPSKSTTGLVSVPPNTLANDASACGLPLGIEEEVEEEADDLAVDDSRLRRDPSAARPRGE